MRNRGVVRLPASLSFIGRPQRACRRGACSCTCGYSNSHQTYSHRRHSVPNGGSAPCHSRHNAHNGHGYSVQRSHLRGNHGDHRDGRDEKRHRGQDEEDHRDERDGEDRQGRGQEEDRQGRGQEADHRGQGQAEDHQGQGQAEEDQAGRAWHLARLLQRRASRSLTGSEGCSATSCVSFDLDAGFSVFSY
jgi:hypothetical protein